MKHQVTWNPNNPLHWSEISLWKRSKWEWYKQYGIGKGRSGGEDNPELRFGRMFAEEREQDALAGRNPYNLHIPEKPEFLLEATYHGDKYEGRADGWSPSVLILNDDKTGSVPWTEKKVSEHKQFDMYLMMLWLTHKVKPDDVDITLSWFPTERWNMGERVIVLPNGEEHMEYTYDIRLTGAPPVVFHTKRTMAQILSWIAECKQMKQEMVKYIHAKNPEWSVSVPEKIKTKNT